MFFKRHFLMAALCLAAMSVASGQKVTHPGTIFNLLSAHKGLLGPLFSSLPGALPDTTAHTTGYPPLHATAPQLRAYPNPLNEGTTLCVSGLMADGPLVFDCIDADGRPVFRSQLNIVGGQGRITLSLDRLSAGVYWLRPRHPEVQAVQIVKD